MVNRDVSRTGLSFLLGVCIGALATLGTQELLKNLEKDRNAELLSEELGRKLMALEAGLSELAEAEL